jgi:hypothetical protein
MKKLAVGQNRYNFYSSLSNLGYPGLAECLVAVGNEFDRKYVYLYR